MKVEVKVKKKHMEDQSIFTNSQPKEISEGLQNFIDSMVEEIVLEGKPFDTQKKYLKKFSENEGLDFNKLEADVTTFIEILDSLKKAFSNLQVKLVKEKGKECYISGDLVEKLIKHSSQPNLEGTSQASQSQTIVNNEHNCEDGHKQKDNTKNILFTVLGIAIIGLICFLLANPSKEAAPYVEDDATEMKDVYDDGNDSKTVIEDNSEHVLDTIDWEKMAGKYIDIIKNQKNRGYQRCEYFMFDITDNNYPDLFLMVGDCEADYTMYVFSNYTNDEGQTENVREVFKFGAAHASFYKGSNYIIADCGTQGYYERHKLYYEAGKIRDEVIRQFEDGEWVSPQEPPITWNSPDDYQPIYNAQN